MYYLTSTFLVVTCCLIYVYYKRISNYFENLGVPYVRGFPFLGYLARPMFQLSHLADELVNLYNYNQDAKYIGAFELTQPIYVIRDRELIKDICVKYSESFPDHKPVGDQELDPLFNGNLFNATGNKWKESRHILSPSFTASKMKIMFTFMVKCVENFIKYIEEQPEEAKNMINSEDLFSKYSSDVIATCGFGIEIDSLRNPNNKFSVYGRYSTGLQGILGLKVAVSRVLPGLMKLFRIKIYSDEVTNFFTELVKNNVSARIEKGITRPDMIQLLMDARSKEKKYNIQQYTKMDIVEMTSHAFAFFFAEFTTTNPHMCMLAHELAVNPDVQKKLQDEVDEVMKTYNGKPIYEAINEMLYLDAVFNEVNRLHSQGLLLDRVCKVPFELPPALPGGRSVKLQPGDKILIPVIAIHRDPKIYKNPTKFNPDRYYEKKVTMNDTSNLGFGIGPRSCIGNRFVTMETKILFVHLLAKFNLKANEKTCNPVTYSKKVFSIGPDGGFWLALERRT